MPTLGKKKFAYTKKGKAAYKAAKKSSKMNETYNRMFNLVIEESQAIEQFFQRKARGAAQAATTPVTPSKKIQCSEKR